VPGLYTAPYSAHGHELLHVSIEAADGATSTGDANPKKKKKSRKKKA
jgi:hypothetical protein